jgi:hypothetical protein
MVESINFQLPENGFGNYVKAILPSDQAVLAGAFASSMMNIKNIQYVNLESFAQVVYSIETNNGLPLINGTNVPVDTFLVGQALSKIALGSDIYGTYNMSNFIGSVTGVPYPLSIVYDLIRALETENLYNIYDDLYLAVKWEGALATVTYQTQSVQTSVGPPALYDWQYKITNIILTNPGGGYGRESAIIPTGTLGDNGSGYYSGDGGAVITISMDTDPNNVPGTYGTLSVQTTAGSWVTYATGQTSSTPADPGLTFQIQAPPITNAGVPGVNSAFGTVGWPSLNTIIDNYVILADAEISAIQTQSPEAYDAAQVLNTYWNAIGIELKIEQRSRYAAIAPVAIPYFKWLTPYPLALINFIDNIPSIAADTCPNGPAQNIENNVDLCDPGGQSIVGLMREVRNQQRLIGVGLEQDNTISNEIPEELDSQQCVNGTVPGAVEGIPSPLGEYTLPSWPTVKTCEGEPLSPGGTNIYDPNYQGLRRVVPVGYPPKNYNQGNINVILNLTPDNLPPTIVDNTGQILPIFPDGNPNNNPIPIIVVNPNIPTGPSTPIGPGGIPIELPTSVTETTGIGTGITNVTSPAPEIPYFPVGNVLPFRLNSNFSSSTLLPAQYDIASAIDKVIECNCDCWVN